MKQRRTSASTNRLTYIIIVAMLVFGSFGIIVTTANDIDLQEAVIATSLTNEESAYYKYVAPRLDRLVTEVDDVVVMVEGKSRDILALSISGNRIEMLTEQISKYGESSGVPESFVSVHDLILSATDTTTYTFQQAREALRSFNFSSMSSLVTDFQSAANELHDAQSEMQAIGGGIEDAMAPIYGVERSHRDWLPYAHAEQEQQR